MERDPRGSASLGYAHRLAARVWLPSATRTSGRHRRAHRRTCHPAGCYSGSQHRESRGMEDSRGPRVASPSGTADSFNSSTRLEQNQELSR